VPRTYAFPIEAAIKCEHFTLCGIEHGALKAEVALRAHAVDHTWWGEGADVAQELAACKEGFLEWS